MVRGQYNPKQKLPLVPLSDGVGEVVAVGPGVTRVAVGQRVAPTFIQDLAARPVDRDGTYLRRTLGGPLDGTLTETMVLSAENVARVPDHLSDVEAATLPCAGVTAWSALCGQGELHAGDTVVVQGTGGVALFALQIAAAAGARAVAVSSSDEKLERARALGAEVLINYKRVPAWGAAVRDATGGLGADHVVDVGGAATVGESLQAVRAGGTISLIGNLGGNKAELDLVRVFMRNIRIQGVFVGSRRELEDLGRALERGQVRPVIDRVFGFDESRGAFEHFAAGDHVGKIAIQIR
jgi:NADPH:quinone reductase-like Zn-dependent oxidoreductase